MFTIYDVIILLPLIAGKAGKINSFLLMTAAFSDIIGRMASYRGHLGFGGLGAAAGVAALSAYTVVKDTETLAVASALVLVGSLLPDIDSDSSLPFFLSYGTFTMAATAVITYHTLLSTAQTQQRFLIPLIAFALLWFVGGAIIKRFTKHRGIFHSLPAMAVAALAVVYEATQLNVAPLQATLFGIAVGAGFLSHLVLDEVYALLGINSYSFLPLPSKSFGSALKLWAGSLSASFACYGILSVLAYLTYPVLYPTLNALL